MEKKPEHHDRRRAAPHVPTLEDPQAWSSPGDTDEDRHDREIAEHEELVQLRARALEAQKEAEAARTAQHDLLAQMREANEKLVLATLRAEELAEQATAARLTATESEERFRLLVTTSAAIVWQASPEGSIQFDPESWSAFTGMTADEASRAWLEAVHPEDRQRVGDAWAHATATTTAYSCQHRLRRRDDDYAWVVARAVPIMKEGVVREWIGMISDVSDRVRIEEARETFIGILGHDLRAPLASISMGAELLAHAEALRAEQHAKVVAQIIRSAERMTAMIRDVLDFAVSRRTTVPGCSRGPGSGPTPGRGGPRRTVEAGSSITISLPRPTPSLSADTVPPWRLTSFLTIASPSPRPPWARSSACASCANISKT